MKLVKLIGPMEPKRLMEIMGRMRRMDLIGLISLTSLMGVLSGCSMSNEGLEPEPEPVIEEVAIRFNGNELEEQMQTRVNGQTRAGTPLSDAGVTQFKVWGYKNMSYTAGNYGDLQTVFPGYTVKYQANSAATTATNSSNWEYILLDPPGQTIKYWDWDANAYRFYAVTGTPADDAADLAAHPDRYLVNETNMPNGPYEMTFSADVTDMATTPYFSRLWFSTGEMPAYADKQFGKPVQLEFLKPYARVRFIFKYVYPREGIKLDDQEFRPTAAGDKIIRKGTVTISYPLAGTETCESFTMTPDNTNALDKFTVDYDPEDDSKDYSGTDKGWYAVLPNNSQGSYTLSVKINNVDKSCVVPAQYMQWQPGYSYTYIFKITDEGGVEIGWVEYVVTPWTEMEANWTTYNW